MIKRIRKMSSLLVLIAALVTACCQLPDAFTYATQTSRQVDSWDRVANPPAVTVPPVRTDESTWRYTRFGWQDSSEWVGPTTRIHPPQRRFDQLHPVTFALLVVLGVMTATLWASNEWEVARLIGADESVDQ